MTAMLDPDARDLLRLAKLAEQALPRDPERVRQRVLVLVGAGAATSAVAGHSAAAKTTGVVSSHAGLAASWLPGVVKAALVASGLAAAGGAVYRMGAAQTSQISSAQHANVTPGAADAPRIPALAALDATKSVAPESLRAAAITSARPDSPTPKVRVAREALRTSRAFTPESEPGKHEGQPASLPEPVPAASHSLSADLRTLRAAQQALNSGAPARTLALLRDLRGSELLAEQCALEVFALCELGQTEAASRKAALFRSIASSSPLLPRVNASCAKP